MTALSLLRGRSSRDRLALSREGAVVMRETLTPEQTFLLQRLFTSSARWGWEYREPAALKVFPRPRPSCYLPLPSWSAEFAAKKKKAELAAKKRAQLAAQKDADDSPSPVEILVILSLPLLFVLIGLLIEAYPIPVAITASVICCLAVAWKRWRTRRVAAGHREWMEACVAAHDRYREELQRWTAAKQDHDQREWERLATYPAWGPIYPGRGAGRLDVCGGTACGWGALITGAGASLLGSGAQLTIVDLSQDSVAAELAQFAELRGYETDVVVLPEHMRELDLFAGLTPDEIVNVLVEALHGDHKNGSPEARSTDARILGAVCEALDAPLTLGRICAGLSALLREEPALAPGEALTGDEYERINSLFGAIFRKSAEPRVCALESRLHHVRHLGQNPDRPLGSVCAKLRVVAVTEQASDLVADFLSPLLLQLLIHGMRRGPTEASREPVLMVAGADKVRRRHLERLDQLTRRRGIRLVYLFRHLRDDPVDVLGSGGAALFMRLGNVKEATAAADFIGREHKFVLHQLTRSIGQSATETVGDSFTETIGTSESNTRTELLRWLLPPIPDSSSYTVSTTTSRAWGRSRSQAAGTTSGESLGQQRVYEYEVEPRTLQTVPDTAFLYVDREGRRGRRVTAGDCNPDILTLPNVSAEPFDSSSA